MKYLGLEKKLTAIVLVFVLTFTSISWEGICIKDIFAAEQEEKDEKQMTAEAVPVDKSAAVMKENTLNSTTFDLGDGKRKIVFYSADVRFEDEEGKLTDYDPVLIGVDSATTAGGADLSEYSYENKEGDKKHYFPEKLSEDTPLLMENGKYSISIAPVFGDDKKDSEQDIKDVSEKLGDKPDNLSLDITEIAGTVTELSDSDLSADELSDENMFEDISGTDRLSLQKEDVDDAYEQTIKKKVSAVYQAGDSMDIIYTSMTDGVKEAITLKERPDSNVFVFRLNTGGLLVEKDNDAQSFTLCDPDTLEPVAYMQAPFMVDGNGDNYSEDISMEVEEDTENEGDFLVTMTVDEDYLSSEDISYPVTIDPTLTWKNTSQLKDVYTISGSKYGNTNFYDNSIVMTRAGRNSNGVYRGYVKFVDLKTILTDYYVEKASLTLYETGNSKSGNKINIYGNTESWSLGTLTYNNRPTYKTTPVDSFKTTGTTGKARTFDLTSWVKGLMVDGKANYGVMFRADDESKSSFGEFYSTRHGTSSKRPKLSIIVDEKPTTAKEVHAERKDVRYGEKDWAKDHDIIDLSWKGITSVNLDHYEYRIEDSTGNDIVTYSSARTLKDITASHWEIELPDNARDSDTYKIYVKGIDTQKNRGTGKSATVKVDNKAPQFMNISMAENTSESSPSSDLTPQISYKLKEDNLWSLKVTVQSGKEKKTEEISPNDVRNNVQMTYTLPEGMIGAGGEYEIFMEAADRAGNVTASSRMSYFVRDDRIDMTGMEPQDLALMQQYGKNTLSWTTDTGIPANVIFEIYRSEDHIDLSDPDIEDQKIGETKDLHWTDMHMDGGTSYYYKVRSCQKDQEGNLIQTADGTDEVQGTAVTETSYTDNTCGEKDWRAYHSFDTPAGSSLVDEASGNVLYSQQDAEIPASIGGFALTRSANSSDTFQGMFGKGWNDTFHKELREDSSGNVFFTDSDGTVTKFEYSQDDDTYRSAETMDMELYSTDTVPEAFVAEGSADAVDENEDENSLVSSQYMGYVTYTVKEDGKKPKEITKFHAWALKTGDRVYRFDEGGRLVSEIDANGNFLLYEYNEDGTVKEVITSGNKSIRITAYDSGKRALRAVLPDDTCLTYTYNSSGQLTQVRHYNDTGNEYISNSYAYTDGKLSDVSDFESNHYQIRYSSEKAERITYPNGEKYDISYQTSQNRTTVSKTGAGVSRAVSVTAATYDDAGKLLSETDASGNSTAYTYGFAGHPYLVTVKESERPYAYLDSEDKVVFSTTTVREEIAYDDEERITEETVEEGDVTETTAYEYSNTPGLTEWNVDEPDSETETVVKDGMTTTVMDTDYSYDDCGNVLTDTDLITGMVVKSNYDQDGNETETTTSRLSTARNADENWITFEKNGYDSDGNQVELNSQSGDMVNGQVSDIQNSTFDTMGRMETNVEGNELLGITETQADHDYLGRETETVTLTGSSEAVDAAREDGTGDVLAQTETCEYNPNGTLASKTTSDGITMSYQYDVLGRVLSATESAGEESCTSTTSYGYETITLSEGTGSRSVYAYKEIHTGPSGTEVTYMDGAGNTVRSVSGGVTTDYIIRNGQTFGSVTGGIISLSLTDENGNNTVQITDATASGERYQLSADSIVKRNGYDGSGNLTSETDGEGILTSYSYDEQKRIASVTQDEGGSGHKNLTSTIRYEEHDDGMSTVIRTDPKGHSLTETTNGAGLVITEDDRGTATDYAYDMEGKLTTETYADGSRKVYTYDRKGLTAKVTYYDGSSEETETRYSYDEKGRVTAMSDYELNGEDEVIPYRHTLYGYDSWGRQAWIAEVDTDLSLEVLLQHQDLINQYKSTYTHDSAGRVAGIDYPESEQRNVKGIRYTYDSQQRLSEVKAVVKNGNSTRQEVLRSYQYDSLGRVSQMTSRPGFQTGSTGTVTTSYTYDRFDRVTLMESRKGNTIIRSDIYTYDKASRITSHAETDHAVTGAYTDEETVYSYDNLGQLIRSERTDNTDDSVHVSVYTYDTNGNRVGESIDGVTATSSYNAKDQRMTTITYEDGQITSNETVSYDERGNEEEIRDSITGLTTKNSYDPAGRLKKRTVLQGEDVLSVQENRYNGEGQRVRKTEGNEEVCYHYLDGNISNTTDAQNDILMQYLTVGNSVIAGEDVTNDHTYLYTKDVENSTRDLIDENGNGVCRYKYSDYGETACIGAASSNEVCYTGGVYDESTGLYYLNARYYDPATGRFLTQDTYRGETERPETWELYTYCNNDPMNYVDPSGHIPMALVSGVVGAVIGVIVDYAPVLLCNFIMHAGKLRNFVLRKKDLIYSAMSGMIDGLLVSSRLKRNAQMVAGAVKAGLITALKNRRKDITTLVTKVVKAAIWGGALAFLGGSGVGAKYWEKGLFRKGCYVYKGVSFKYRPGCVRISSRSLQAYKTVVYECVFALMKGSRVSLFVNTFKATMENSMVSLR